MDSANLVDFVESASDTQPNIMDSMKPNSGVTMREGNNVRSGPKAEVGFGKMTKKDYFNMMGKGGAFEELEHTLEHARNALMRRMIAASHDRSVA